LNYPLPPLPVLGGEKGIKGVSFARLILNLADSKPREELISHEATRYNHREIEGTTQYGEVYDLYLVST
jgi:hypothetical protein